MHPLRPRRGPPGWPTTADRLALLAFFEVNPEWCPGHLLAILERAVEHIANGKYHGMAITKARGLRSMLNNLGPILEELRDGRPPVEFPDCQTRDFYGIYFTLRP